MAMVTSTTPHFVEVWSNGRETPTTVKQESLMKPFHFPFESSPFRAGSVTTTKCHGCLFEALGAWRPA